MWIKICPGWSFLASKYEGEYRYTPENWNNVENIELFQAIEWTNNNYCPTWKPNRVCEWNYNSILECGKK